MKKIIPVLVVLILLVIGVFLYMKSKNPSSNATVGGPAKTGEQTNVITSIKDALTKSVSLVCNYKDDSGKQTSVYIKAGSVRSIVTAGGDKTQPNNFILAGGKMYIWNDSTKAGFMYTMKAPTTTVAPTTASVTGQVNNAGDKSQSYLAEIEKFKNDCKPGVVDSGLFAAPADVNFQDMDAILNNQNKMPGQGTNPTDYQKYIQQVTQQQAGQ